MGAYWPDGVTMPQHLWPFFQTGDYSDQGSTGGLTLTAQGSGNSFDANGLNLNGSGYASYTSYDADLNNIGGTYSLLFEGLVSATGTIALITPADNSGVPCYMLYLSGGSIYYYTYATGWSGESLGTYPGYEQSYQIIIVASGGNVDCYIDGSHFGTQKSIAAPNDVTDFDFTIAALDGGNWKMPADSYIKRIGILKGTAWTSDNVADIYAWSPTTGYTLSVASGAYVETGISAGLRATRKIIPAVGNYVETGTAAGVIKKSKIIPNSGSYTETGTIATLKRNGKLIPLSGTYQEFGIPASLIYSGLAVTVAGGFIDCIQVKP